MVKNANLNKIYVLGGTTFRTILFSIGIFYKGEKSIDCQPACPRDFSYDFDIQNTIFGSIYQPATNTGPDFIAQNPKKD